MSEKTTETASEDSVTQASTPAPSVSEPESESLAESPTSPAPAPSKSGVGWLALILVLLTLIALAVVGYPLWQQAQTQTVQLAQLTQQLEQSRDQAAAMAGWERRLASLQEQQAALQNLPNQLQQNEAELVRLQQRLAGLRSPTPKDWQLIEVLHLLRLAEQRLWLMEDVASARWLLQAADDRLKQAAMAGTLGVRHKLQQDLDRLSDMTPPDRGNHALVLQTLADQALTLPMHLPAQVPGLNSVTLSANESMTWYQALWQDLRRLVVIRQRELPVEPLPYVEEEKQLRYQMSSLLQQAAWASLNSDQALFRQSLEGVAARAQGLDLSEPSNQAFVQAIEGWREVSVEWDVSTPLSALEALEILIQERALDDASEAAGEGS